MKNRIICCVMCLVMLVGCLCGCSEAEKVNKNISKQANYFETERHITVYNARTDKVILEAEGLMSITNNSSNELVCTIKTGPNTYTPHQPSDERGHSRAPGSTVRPGECYQCVGCDTQGHPLRGRERPEADV